MTVEPEPIHLAGGTMRGSRHVCAFFHSAEEELRVLAPFIKEGFERGDKAFHIVDPKLREGYPHKLAGAGIPCEGCQEKQFEVRVWEEAYLRDGRFDRERMVELIQEVLQRGREEGFSTTRLVAHMEWALEDRPGVDDIVVYETMLNYVLPRYHDPVICTYDLNKFDGSVVVDIMRTHPMVILGGVLQENPFFVPPDQLLQELRERSGRAATA